MKKRTYRLLCVLAGTVLLVTGALTGCSTSGKSGVSKGDGIQQTEEAGAAELETLSEVATLETTETEDAAALLRYLPLYLMML